MMKALVPLLLVTTAGLAAAAVTKGVGVDLTTAIAVVAGVSSDVPVTSVSATSPVVPSSSSASACMALAASAGSADPAPGTARCGPPSHVTLQDRVYFGTYWQELDTALVLGGGYTNARIMRTNDGDFFAGMIDKIDASGQVTDVILAFAGAQGVDAVEGESILAGVPLDEAARATRLYEGLLTDPRYTRARIHVTGHSLGAGYTQYVLAYALGTHGAPATDARADFLAFGVPSWLGSAAAHFGVDRSVAGARLVGFTASNDPVLVNGIDRLGINNYLPPFTGLPGLDAAVDVLAAHQPTTYAAALGLPDWLSAADQQAATAAVSAKFTTGNSIAPGYGPAGRLPLTVEASDGAEWLEGLGGDDRLIGHGGADVMTGGAGADVFVYRQRGDSGVTADTEDRITDFSTTEGDRIDLSALASLRALTFVGAAAFSGPGQVRSRYEGGQTLIEIALTGISAPDMVIRLDGHVALTSGDFILGGI